jgi:hypothetical protein
MVHGGGGGYGNNGGGGSNGGGGNDGAGIHIILLHLLCVLRTELHITAHVHT